VLIPGTRKAEEREADMKTGDRDDSFNELVRRGIRDFQEAQELLLSYARAKRESLQRWAGDRLSAMLHNRREAEGGLMHNDPKVRVAALCLLKDHWVPTADTARLVEYALFNDLDPRVRGVAVMTLLRAHTHASPSSKDLVLAIAKDRKRADGTPLKPFKELNEDIVRNIEVRSQARKEQLWQALAGPTLWQMLASRENTEKVLYEEDPKLRMAALFLLCDHWPHRADLAELCERMAYEDSDIQVRAIAIGQLGVLNRGTDDPRIGATLAKIVYDDLNPLRVRLAAYRALFQLRAIPFMRLSRSGALKKDFRFPEDCDWAFVDSFLMGKEKSAILEKGKEKSARKERGHRE
jgi:hypothetical protein